MKYVNDLSLRKHLSSQIESFILAAIYHFNLRTLKCWFLCWGCWVFFLVSCTSHNEKSLQDICSNKLDTISFQSLRDSVQNELYRFKTELYLPAYVISSDQFGQFYGRLVLEEPITAKTILGAVLETDMTGTSLWYPSGQKVYVNLKGLYADHKTTGLSIGSVFASFGNLSIGRLPALSAQARLSLSCDPIIQIPPKARLLDKLSDLDLQTLVSIDSLQLDSNLAGQSFAVYEEDSFRAFYDTKGEKIMLRVSGYSDFWDALLPTDWVRITGILGKKRSQYHIEIRGLQDVAPYGM